MHKENNSKVLINIFSRYKITDKYVKQHFNIKNNINYNITFNLLIITDKKQTSYVLCRYKAMDKYLTFKSMVM